MNTIISHVLRQRIFYGILLLSILLRVPLIFTSQSHVDSDASETGIMAKHILEKGEHPLYGRRLPYNGGAALEAHLGAILFYLFGVSSQTLKGVGLSLSLIALAVTFYFTSNLFGRRLANLSALLFSLATPLIEWNLQMRGGYLETMIFTVLIFFIMYKIFWEGRKSWHYYAMWGFLSGLAWWNLEIILSFLVTSCILWFILDRKLFLKSTTLVFVVFFILGCSPFIYYNLTHNYQNVKFVFGSLLMKKSQNIGEFDLWRWGAWKIQFIYELFSATLPRFFEPDNEWSYFRGISLLSWVQYFIVLCGFGNALRIIFGSRSLINKYSIMFIYIIAHLGAYCFFNPYDSPDVQRFLILLFPYLSILTASLIISLYDGKIVSRYMGVGVLLVIVGIGEISYISSMGKKSEWLDLDYKLERNGVRVIFLRTEGETISRVISFLKSRNIRYVHSTYVIKYRLIFESGETIFASSEYFQPENEYYPYYENMIRDVKSQPRAVVLFQQSGFFVSFQHLLHRKNVVYKRKDIGEMVVFYPFTQKQLAQIFTPPPLEKTSQ